jgi:DNA-binding response OmpR family regulator
MPRRIMVVDGDPDVRDLIAGGLKAAGYEVLPVRSGEECLAGAPTEQPDVVCLEIALPGTDGLETARRLLADPATGSIPIVFLTARKGLQDRLEGLRLGAHAYLTKPFAFPELLATLQNILQRSAAEDAGSAPAPVGQGLGLIGSLGALSLAAMIQALEGEQQTGVLRVVSGTRWGQLAFHQGKMVAAAAGPFMGEKAIVELIGWETGTYTFRAEIVEPGPPLAESATSILMRAMQHHDERRAAPST